MTGDEKPQQHPVPVSVVSVDSHPMPVVSVNADGTQLSPKSLFVRWWLGQEASTVILVLILLWMGYIAWWYLTIGLPQNSARTEQVFQKIAADNNETNKATASMVVQAMERLERMIERAMDRSERRSPKEKE